jgi:protein gp37
VRRRVFVGSMCDWAEVHPVPEIAAQMDAARARLWAEIHECAALDFLLLTKRPESAAELLPWSDGMRVARLATGERAAAGYLFDTEPASLDPWPNVWLGVTAGTTAAMLKNVPILRSIPAAVRFVSCEPLLEDIPRHVWDGALAPFGNGPLGTIRPDGGVTRPHTGIDWLIVGDESGHHARPAQVDWVRAAREAALRHGVAFHFKQWAGVDVGGISGRLPSVGKATQRRKIHLPLLDGKQWAQFPNKER